MINQIGISVNNYATQSVSSAPAAKASGEVEFSYNAQDQFVKEPGTAVLPDVTVGKNGPQTERVVLHKTKLEPNSDGSYVFDQKDKNFTGAQTFATVNKTLDMFEEACGCKIPWATRHEQIKLIPDGGETMNAYYSRNDNSLNFFHAGNPATNETIYTGNSGEVVSHEVGHAMLDGLRPGYLSAWSPDPGGFHESFGDCIALFMSTQDDATAQIAADQTGGDLTKQNCLAHTGEELGKTINDSAGGGKGTGGNYIRNAINDFKWADPSTLPDRPKDGGLGTEVHSWSRLFTGAVYDVMTGIVARNVAEGMDPKAAIKDGGAQMISLYGNLMKEAPKGDFTYEQMANCLLKADANHMDGKNQDIIRESFTNRNILHGGMGVNDVDYGASDYRMMSVKLDGDGFGMFSGAKVETPVSGMSTMESNNAASSDLKTNMRRLISSGRILYTEPNQKVEQKDLFDKDGVPYMGVVRWVDGEMTIERNHMID